jgi:hypothetical protein
MKEEYTDEASYRTTPLTIRAHMVDLMEFTQKHGLKFRKLIKNEPASWGFAWWVIYSDYNFKRVMTNGERELLRGTFEDNQKVKGNRR